MKITLREYQKKAIESFENNNYSGILEMATGTGKTITSIIAAKRYYCQKGKIFLVVLVPYIHLSSQWEKEAKKLGFKHIITCHGETNWRIDLSFYINKYNFNFINALCVICTYKTNNNMDFVKLINRVEIGKFLIADECHHFGTKNTNLENYFLFEGKLGLSATPKRWWDEDGTQKIYSLFGRTIFKYDLDKAIGEGYLVNYRYNPIIVDLLESEYVKYRDLTKKIQIYLNSDHVDEKDLLPLLLRRQEIIANAKNKEEILIELFKNKTIDEVNNALIYCSPQTLHIMTEKLADLGYRVRKFFYKTNTQERDYIIKAFANQDIQILTAIKCLDEGVDIPSIEDAYFLSSTSNPKEFIQRRGRVLRKSEGKFIANIYDFIVLPKNVEKNIFTSIAKGEMPRFAEFSKSAINESRCRRGVRDSLSDYGLDYLMDKLPWEVYHEMMGEWKNEY